MSNATDILAFPDGFLWGAATASHQVEGGNVNNDWWAWEQQPGRIADGTRSGLASNWWQMAERDLTTAAQLGHNTHRLSLEWSRLEPAPGEWDEAVVARYRQILTAMRNLGLTPMATLHHFTLPLWLYERGGWENPAVVDWFSHYVERAVVSFGDLVPIWCTINEPMVQISYGYISGVWPPGGGGFRAARIVLRHMAQAHASAYSIIHQRQPEAQVGCAQHLHLFDPASPRWPDRLAAKMLDRLFNGSALAAFFDGTLPFPFGWGQKLSDKRLLLDFIGLNYYSRSMTAFDLHRKDQMYVRRFANPDAPFSMEGWGEIYPEGLYRALLRLANLGLPIYVTEFGVPDNTDAIRPRFIVEHVAAIERAIRHGALVRGAYFWSLVDNFEWAAGWSGRFGLIHLDPETQARRINGSADIYRRIAVANGLERSLVNEVAPDLVEPLFGS